ncbi:uncharacterized protein DUF4229 [Mumia flava]|uniref:Uncharacterized protein DUF4229 n=1 Tax=Mumia flava TaxID=1348852 RepID=A0A0B2BQJ2_9ACTN|nr:DUF4229 domain-containing protein [Mumia flava]PJJ58186.1 uncharacterized protein DUF4229 [Mumia flava]
MSAFVRYTLARLALFVVTFAVVAGIGMIWFEWDEMTGLLFAIIALAISAVLSLLLLGGLRDQVAESLQARSQKLHDRFEQARGAEDVD